MSYEIFIPFSGFYNSIHDHNLEREVESFYSDPESGMIETDVQQQNVDDFPWDKMIHSDYAKLYVDTFNDEFDQDGPFTFKELISPREYNFETDRILCTVESSFIQHLYLVTPRHALQKYFTKHFTSRSGFASFYNPRLLDAPPVNKWDYNQLQALLEAYMEFKDIMQEDDSDLYFMDDVACNGHLATLIDECLSRKDI